jgi:hypothetical protein
MVAFWTTSSGWTLTSKFSGVRKNIGGLPAIIQPSSDVPGDSQGSCRLSLASNNFVLFKCFLISCCICLQHFVTYIYIIIYIHTYIHIISYITYIYMPIYYTALSGDQSWLAGTQKRYLTCWAVLCFLVQSLDPMRSTNDFVPTWKGTRKKRVPCPKKMLVPRFFQDVGSMIYVHDGFFQES